MDMVARLILIPRRNMRSRSTQFGTVLVSKLSAFLSFTDFPFMLFRHKAGGLFFSFSGHIFVRILAPVSRPSGERSNTSISSIRRRRANWIHRAVAWRTDELAVDQCRG